MTTDLAATIEITRITGIVSESIAQVEMTTEMTGIGTGITASQVETIAIGITDPVGMTSATGTTAPVETVEMIVIGTVIVTMGPDLTETTGIGNETVTETEIAIESVDVIKASEFSLLLEEGFE